ncbi:MAG: hypothetical protein AAF804_21105, partial [Bacteroidota bacterium]
MHFHHFTLKQLAQYLEQRHRGEKVMACFSQSKNELVLVFEDLILRIGCNTPDTYAVPVSDFAKARKNVVDLFEPIYGLSLARAYAVAHERELILGLSEDHQLVLKMHGTMANVLLRHQGKIVALFDHRHEDDWEYQEQPGSSDFSQLDQVKPDSKRKLQEALR